MSFGNDTILPFPHISVLRSAQPFYYTENPEVIAGIPDNYISLAAPFFAYWSLSLIFYGLDCSGWAWLDRYRIHESEEITSRNKVTKLTVLYGVLVQQALQTALGLAWLDSDPSGNGGTVAEKHLGKMLDMAPVLHNAVMLLCGDKFGAQLWAERAGDMVYFVYWWGVPFIQLIIAMFVLDTWQYFLHRAMHINLFMYQKIHSVHHRLYAPYAFGALYNHPLEGFLLDSLGAVLAEACSFMSVRQAAFLFAVSTFKTVDDHCGYSLPFDPLQWFTSNNADYHDIHHQVIGIKSNFSQPFFVHWDAILGTRMTRKDIEERRKSKKLPAKEL